MPTEASTSRPSSSGEEKEEHAAEETWTDSGEEQASPLPSASKRSKRLQEAAQPVQRWCKKCKVAFAAEYCPETHAPIMYVDKIPTEAEQQPQPQEKPAASAEASAPVAQWAPIYTDPGEDILGA